MTELRQSLQTANDSATGLDQVHYQLLTHLPNSALSILLKVYNHVYITELHEQEMGVPQGSIMSPALFNIKITNIVKAVLKGTDCSLFVDDLVCFSQKILTFFREKHL